MQNDDNKVLDALLKEIRQTFKVEFTPLQIDDICLQVLDIENMQSHLTKLLATNAIQEPLRDLPLWAKIWPGSFILGRFLRKFEPEGKSMLELGAGMGILSLVAAHYGFQSILATDNNTEALKFCRANVLRNNLDSIIKTRRLDLERDKLPQDQAFDIIAASEFLYLDNLFRPILKFLSRHLAPGGKALFCVDMARKKPAFAKLAAKSFTVQEGNIGMKADDGERHVYSIAILSKK